MTGARILIVVYEDGGLMAYAAAFSNKGDADAFAAGCDGVVIDTFVDVHVVKKEDETNA